MDRRRVLDRPRPDVHMAKLVVAPVPREGIGVRPGAANEVMRFLVLLARQRRYLPVAVIRVHRRADRETGDEPSARNAVEHREFFGDAHRRIVERDGIAEHHEADIRCPPRKPRRDDVRRGHDAVAVLVMLVDADAVEAERAGIFEHVHVGVVDLVRLCGVEQARVDIDPDRAVLLPEIVRQKGPRHQVEPREFHCCFLPAELFCAAPRRAASFVPI